MNNEMTHDAQVFEAAQIILSGLVAGPYFSVSLVSAMQRSERSTLGQILVNEAWDMAECLVERFETKRNSSNAK